MEELLPNSEYQELHPIMPGDKVLRLRRRRRKLRGLSWSAVMGVIKDLVIETPFLFMLPIVCVLWLVFSAGLYFAEAGATGSAINSYPEGLWAGVVLMTTAGTMTEPVTTAGHVVGAIWTILGCFLFYGTIIASASAYFLLPLTSYFLLPRRGEQSRLVGTIQYNLGRLEDLSEEDLEALEQETTDVIHAALKRRRGAE
jgi:voltage-gated potassium channel